MPLLPDCHVYFAPGDTNVFTGPNEAITIVVNTYIQFRDVPDNDKRNLCKADKITQFLKRFEEQQKSESWNGLPCVLSGKAQLAQIWGKQLLELTSRRIRFEKRVNCIARTQHIGFCSVPKGLLASSSELLPFHGLGAAPPDLISYLPKATSRSASTHGAAAGLQNSDGAVRRGLRKQDGIPWHDHRHWSHSSNGCPT